MGRRTVALLARSVILLLAMLTGAQMTNHVNAQPPPTISSGWMTQPVVVDGRMTTADEWSDAIAVDLTLSETYGQEKRLISARVWIKNDLKHFCILMSVKWPTKDVDQRDTFQFFIRLGYKGDASEVNALGRTNDFYVVRITTQPGLEQDQSLEDAKMSPPGKNNVEGGASYDGTRYWFELRKELNTGDPYDLVLVPGQRYYEAYLNMRGYTSGGKYETKVMLQLAPVLPSIEIVKPEHEAITRVSQVNFTALALGHLNKVALVVEKEHDMKFNEKTGLYESLLTLADGTYKWLVKAEGVLGNVTTIPERSLTVDATKPTIVILSPASGAVIEKSEVYVSWQCSDATSGIAFVELKVNALDWIDVTGKSSHTVTGLAEGNHEVRVRAIDKAGNVAEKIVTFTFLPPPWYVTYWYLPVISVATVVAIATIMISRRRPPKLPTKPPEVEPLRVEPPARPPTREELLKELEELYKSSRITETAYRRLKKKYETDRN